MVDNSYDEGDRNCYWGLPAIIYHKYMHYVYSSKIKVEAKYKTHAKYVL